jgi:hypothetical protein
MSRCLPYLLFYLYVFKTIILSVENENNVGNILMCIGTSWRLGWSPARRLGSGAVRRPPGEDTGAGDITSQDK